MSQTYKKEKKKKDSNCNEMNFILQALGPCHFISFHFITRIRWAAWNQQELQAMQADDNHFIMALNILNFYL